MRIAVPSSLVSGVYTCLELLLTLLTTQLITFAIRAWNVKRVYADNAKLHLTSSRLDTFFGYGLSSKKVSIAAALVFTSVVGLATIGGFSIVGRTGKHYEPTLVRNLVTKAAPDEYVDYSENHISYGGLRFSGTVFLLLQLVGCRRSSSPGPPVVYEYFNDLHDITTRLFRPEQVDLNQTCITAKSGYRQRIALQESAVAVRDRDVIANCSWEGFSPSMISQGEYAKVPVRQQDDCPYPVQEAWCLRTEGLFCAGQVTSGSTPAVVITTSERTEGDDQLRTDILLVDEPPVVENLKSVVALLGFRADITAATLWGMTLLTVKTDVSVDKFISDRKETEVNEVLLAATLGPALLILAVTGIVALVGWIKYIALPNRGDCNHFNSLWDLVSLGLDASDVDGERGRSIRQGLTIGVHENEPQFSIREETARTGEAWIPQEGGLQGTP